ncbi:Similar to Uncharacterized protein YEL023C; acc. no. P39992 [Pyronema omphalodes CBS 100304]|uniref:Similar to Uncharacterized protein YEL023C acc. no. P39992 n=1 Tax=Pyronema omphalodes (strain CBS 100304) TaxID=1076935 RepID=U4LD96_PYROM|nr:Similar to Uncharacterized protein YEL023C; acc. no. P39992 [Pyronema omphalodes CBS 100304]
MLPGGADYNRAGHQRKKLILCFDGTGNKFKGNSGDTNILKIFRMLDRSGEEQSGIGTYITNGTLSRVHVASRMKSWVDKAMDAAVGTSFDQHVMGGYKFLMRFYAPGDDIYMFGFSRGAYTARFLAEMLDHVGLVAQGNEEMVLFAWKTFSNWQQRHDSSKKRALYEYMRAFRETFARPVRRVRFLGLFDTVNSVPRFEQAWLKRSSGFPYTARSSARVIRHAVGIDERRAKFRQDLIDKVDLSVLKKQRTWQSTKKNKKKNKNKNKKKSKLLSLSSTSVNKTNGVNGNPVVNGIHHYGTHLDGAESPIGTMSPAAESLVSLNILMENNSDCDSEDEEDSKEQDIEEVWFPGCHADIGGGWDLPADEEPLSQGPLVWMVSMPRIPSPPCNKILTPFQVREARKAGVQFDKQRMKEQNCWIDEFEEDDSSVDDSCENLAQCQNDQASTTTANINGAPVPKIEVTDASPTTDGSVDLSKLAHNHAHAHHHTPDLHKADAAAHTHHHPLRHLKLLRRRHEETPVPQFTPKEFLERSFVRGKIHDCLEFNNGLSHVGVLGWKIMEWLPFRRMDLQPDGSWKAISWPLPRGEVRDIPDNMRIHVSVIKRMEADPTYRPGNLLVGGGGRGVRVAPESLGRGEWVVVHDEGNLASEVWMKKSAWEQEQRIKMGSRFMRASQEGDPEKKALEQ